MQLDFWLHLTQVEHPFIIASVAGFIGALAYNIIDYIFSIIFKLNRMNLVKFLRAASLMGVGVAGIFYIIAFAIDSTTQFSTDQLSRFMIGQAVIIASLGFIPGLLDLLFRHNSQDSNTS